MTTFRKFVINLETRRDRRVEMQKQLDRVGWGAEFIKAIKPDDKGPFPSIGARGCFLSHIETLERGAGSNILMMEDDLGFVPDFQKLWDKAIDRLPSDWSLFYPAHDIADGLIDPMQGVTCTHMVAFNQSAVPRILRGLHEIMSRPAGHELGGPMHVDGAYSTIRSQNPDLRTYGLSSALGYQRSSRSDIAELRFFDRLPILRPLANVARRVLSD